MIRHSSTVHQEMPNEVFSSPVTGMGVEETSIGVALPEPKETRPLLRQGPLERNKPQLLHLEKATEGTLLRGQQSGVHSNIQMKNHLGGQENLHFNATNEF
jgi:hypothetical protein